MSTVAAPSPDRVAPLRGRVTPTRVVCAAALVGFVVRLWISTHTIGSLDVLLLERFTQAAAEHGPWHVYAVEYDEPWSVYNHGPLTSWLLVLWAHLHEWGLGMPFLTRQPAILADVVTTFVLYELVRPVRGDRAAAAAAAVFALAPVGIVISGFHGNTDPVFIMFVLVAGLLMRTERWAFAAGLSVGCALSIKLVPVVALPALLVLAFRHSPRTLRRVFAGGAVVFAVLWVPVLAAEPRKFFEHVLLYRGTSRRYWGVSQFAQWAGMSLEDARRLGDQVSVLIVVGVALLLPLAMWRLGRTSELALLGLPLCVFLLLTTAFSPYYLAWALAPALVLVSVRVAAAYVVFASAFVLLVYSGWSGAPPWDWNYADPKNLPAALMPLMVLVWLSLVRICWLGWRGERPADSEPDRAGDLGLTAASA